MDRIHMMSPVREIHVSQQQITENKNSASGHGKSNIRYMHIRLMTGVRRAIE